ncbi:MAG: hypothetical protein IKY61_04605 [Thermoguttaceae bacterium]|nr:hypothetical protein [Thermoguttaceae bacterium]
MKPATRTKYVPSVIERFALPPAAALTSAKLIVSTPETPELLPTSYSV